MAIGNAYVPLTSYLIHLNYTPKSRQYCLLASLYQHILIWHVHPSWKAFRNLLALHVLAALFKPYIVFHANDTTSKVFPIQVDDTGKGKRERTCFILNLARTRMAH